MKHFAAFLPIGNKAIGGGGALVKAPEEKWGKMGGNGEKWGEMGESVGNFGCSMEKWGILVLKRSKNMVLIGNKAGGGGALVKAEGETEGKWGEMGRNGGKWGKMGKPNQSTLAPQNFCYLPPPPPITPSFPPFPPHFPPIFPHFPPFSPIFPHFPPFLLVLGTLRVRCSVYHHPPHPGISEAWMDLRLCTPAATDVKPHKLCSGTVLTSLPSVGMGGSKKWSLNRILLSTRQPIFQCVCARKRQCFRIIHFLRRHNQDQPCIRKSIRHGTPCPQFAFPSPNAFTTSAPAALVQHTMAPCVEQNYNKHHGFLRSPRFKWDGDGNGAGLDERNGDGPGLYLKRTELEEERKNPAARPHAFAEMVWRTVSRQCRCRAS